MGLYFWQDTLKMIPTNKIDRLNILSNQKYNNENPELYNRSNTRVVHVSCL